MIWSSLARSAGPSPVRTVQEADYPDVLNEFGFQQTPECATGSAGRGHHTHSGGRGPVHIYTSSELIRFDEPTVFGRVNFAGN